jgi:hypothetical protein
VVERDFSKVQAPSSNLGVGFEKQNLQSFFCCFFAIFLKFLISWKIPGNNAPPMNNASEIEHVFHTTCADLIRTRRECWERSLEGRGGEECIREELLEKRCLATNFCPSQAKRFYDSSCQSFIEAFAFGTNQAAREVGRSAKQKKRCRKITMTLSKCLAKYRHFNPTFVPHRDDI